MRSRPTAFQPKPTPLSINMTPLIDVFLIIIIILLLAMPMYVSTLSVDLPKTSLNGTPAISQSLLVELDSTGAVRAQGELVSVSQLLARIDEAVSVQVAADHQVTYGALAELIAQIQSKTPRDISLLTR